MSNLGFGAYAWDDFDTKKKMVALSIYSDVGVEIDLSRKQAKALVKTLNAALEEGK